VHEGALAVRAGEPDRYPVHTSSRLPLTGGASPQVAPATRITGICMIASLFELDCVVKQLDGSGMSRARAAFHEP